MSDQTALIRRELEDGGRDAGRQFQKLIGGSREEKNAVRSVIRLSPATALVALNRGGLGLTHRGEADALDEVLAEIPDTSAAQDLLEEHMTPARRRFLGTGRGDLPSVFPHVVSADDALAVLVDFFDEDAMTTSMEDPEVGSFLSNPKAYFITRFWALNYMERSDFDALLDYEIGVHTVRDMLLLSCWMTAGSPRLLRDISPDIYDQVGLECHFGLERLREMFDEADGPPNFTADEVEQARVQLSRRRKEIEEAPKVEEAARGEADKLAEEVAEDVF